MSKKFIFKSIFVIFFIAFIITYAIGESGYYEYQLSNKRILTEEQMKKFEEDVKNGEDIDLNDYVVDTTKDYSNKFTSFVTDVSLTANNYIKKTIESLFTAVGKMVEEG